MITVKLGKPLHSHFGIERVALMLVFSIFFVPQAVYAEIKTENSIVKLKYIHGQTNKNENIESYDRFFYQESLRNIYTSLRFLNSDNPIKVITMTSSIPKEGKSLINILLSKTLSEMDLKILQIDADLRRPQIHSRLGLNNLTGLSNILTNRELKLSDVTQSVPGFKNWDVITSGTKPPDPTRLLNSIKMNTFIKEIKESNKYDLIVFDTPPVIGLADSLLVLSLIHI